MHDHIALTCTLEFAREWNAACESIKKNGNMGIKRFTRKHDKMVKAGKITRVLK